MRTLFLRTVALFIVCTPILLPSVSLAQDFTTSTHSYTTNTIIYSPTEYGVTQNRSGSVRTIAVVSAPVKPVVSATQAAVTKPVVAQAQTAAVVNSKPTKVATTTPQLPKTGGGGKWLQAGGGGTSALSFSMFGFGLLTVIGALFGFRKLRPAVETPTVPPIDYGNYR